MRPYQTKGLSKVYFALIFVVYVAALFVVNDSYNARVQNHILNTGLQFHQSIIDITNTYENFAGFIFYSDISTPEITEILHRASNSPDENLDEIRDELFNILLPLYNVSTAYNFSQIHFLLDDGISFLRFHNPSAYGDSLVDIRESVNIVLNERRLVTGFEEGRFLSGYRYVYPIFHDTQYVGSVELSVSASSIIRELYKSMNQVDIGMILDVESLSSVRVEDLNIYHVPTFLSNQYMIEKENLEIVNLSSKSLKLINDQAFNDVLLERINGNLLGKSSFGVYLKYLGKNYIVHFDELRNIAGNHVGYIGLVRLDDRIMMFAQERSQLVLIVTGITMLMISIFYLVMKKEEAINKYAMTDALTGIYNRGTFIDFSRKLLARQRREHSPVSLAMIDIDNFKDANDQFGHRVGDKVLGEIANVILECIRDSDVIARYGGDELILLLPDTEIDVAECVLERIRFIVESTLFTKIKKITVSIGVHQVAPHESLDDAIMKADVALYKAKSSGRNQVISSKPSN
jgi:diguanylate cyclase (GGDEF)-like protein